MTGGFIWKVTGVYQHAPVDTLEYAEAVSFECLVISHDPCGRDVPDLALEMRIGPSDCWDSYSPCIETMTCLGWAQGGRDDQAAATP